jgi:hypothetical protein
MQQKVGRRMVPCRWQTIGFEERRRRTPECRGYSVVNYPRLFLFVKHILGEKRYETRYMYIHHNAYGDFSMSKPTSISYNFAFIISLTTTPTFPCLALSLSTLLNIFPEGDLGICSTNSISVNHLYRIFFSLT